MPGGYPLLRAAALLALVLAATPSLLVAGYGLPPCAELAAPGCPQALLPVARTVDSFANPAAAARSPDGAVLYVGGLQEDRATYDGDAFVAAVDLATSTLRWSVFHEGSVPGFDRTEALLAAPDGSRVYAAGIQVVRLLPAGPASYYPVYGAFVRAYEAGSGALLWEHIEAPISTPHGGGARGAALSPDGGTLFVAGGFSNATTRFGMLLALEAATGAPLWERSYPGLTELRQVAPHGNSVVAVTTAPSGRALASFSASDGEAGWSVPLDLRFPERHHVVLFGPEQAYVAGPTSQEEQLLAAYALENGAQAWSQTLPRYDPQHPPGLALSPDGANLLVATGRAGPVALLLDSATGLPRWLHALPGRGAYHGAAFDGESVLLTGLLVGASEDLLATRLAAATGALQVVGTLDPGRGRDQGEAIWAGPDGAAYVLGRVTLNGVPDPGPYHAIATMRLR